MKTLLVLEIIYRYRLEEKKLSPLKDKWHSWSEDWQGIQVVELISLLYMCVLAASARWIPAAMAGMVEPAMPPHRRPVAELHLLISFKRKGSTCSSFLFLLSCLSISCGPGVRLFDTFVPNRPKQTDYGFNILFVLAEIKSFRVCLVHEIFWVWYCSTFIIIW